MAELLELDMKDPGFAGRLGKSLTDTGFAVVVNHKVSSRIIGAAYAASKSLFALPLVTKLACETPKNGRQTGYTPVGLERAVGAEESDLKEFWHVMRDGHPEFKNLFPPGFKEAEALLNFFRELDICADRLLSALAIYLNYSSSHFVRMVESGRSVLRLLHYPAVEGEPKAMRAAPHEDINLLTLLVAADKPGLEIKTRDGEWLPVRTPPDAIIVNAGDMLQLCTDKRIPSTSHRVVNSPEGAVSRYSMPFFVHPRPQIVLSRAPYITAGQFLDARLRANGVK
jgi:isopenicillin N synthase-like dioxygenase